MNTLTDLKRRCDEGEEIGKRIELYPSQLRNLITQIEKMAFAIENFAREEGHIYPIPEKVLADFQNENPDWYYDRNLENDFV